MGKRSVTIALLAAAILFWPVSESLATDCRYCSQQIELRRAQLQQVQRQAGGTRSSAPVVGGGGRTSPGQDESLRTQAMLRDAIAQYERCTGRPCQVTGRGERATQEGDASPGSPDASAKDVDAALSNTRELLRKSRQAAERDAARDRADGQARLDASRRSLQSDLEAYEDAASETLRGANVEEAETAAASVLSETERLRRRLEEVTRGLEPGSPEASYNKGTALLEAGQLDLAVDELQRALDRLGDSAPADLHYNIGLAFARRNGLHDRDHAGRHLREAVARAPLEPEMRYSLGVLHARGGEYDQSEAELIQALALDPADARPRQAIDWARESGCVEQTLREAQQTRHCVDTSSCAEHQPLPAGRAFLESTRQRVRERLPAGRVERLKDIVERDRAFEAEQAAREIEEMARREATRPAGLDVPTLSDEEVELRAEFARDRARREREHQAWRAKQADEICAEDRLRWLERELRRQGPRPDAGGRRD